MNHSDIKSKNLLLGASGFLGSYFVDTIDNAVKHTASKNQGEYDLKISFENHQDILAALSSIRVNRIFNTIGLTDIERCESNQELAMWLNCDLPRIFAHECFKRNIQFIHFSTDAVFDGVKSMSKETDQPNPKSFYGKSKLYGENSVLLENTKSLILRVNFFGLSQKNSLFNFFYYAGLKKSTVRGFSDIFFTTLYARDLARITNRLARQNCYGLFHLVGSQRLTKLQFGKLVFKEFGFDSKYLEPGSIEENSSLKRELRSRDLSLSNNKLSQLGIAVPTVESGLKSIREEVKKYDSK